MAAISRTSEKMLNAFVSMGAAVVIFGAWQKILHQSLADLFLTIGLLTEAGIFLIYGLIAFRGYGLTDQRPSAKVSVPRVSLAAPGAVPKLPDEQMGVLNANLQKLTTVASQMTDLGNVAKISQSFAAEVTKTSGAFSAMGGMIRETGSAMGSFRKAASDLGGIGTQTQQLSQSLTALNQVYQQEIQNSSRGMKNVEDFYSGLSEVARSLKGSLKEAEETRKEMVALSSNLSQLNQIYGSMIAAMRK